MLKLSLAHRNQLIDQLTDGFNLTDLKILAARLGIDEDDLNTSNKHNIVISLLTFLERRQRLPELITLGQQLRPELNWPPIPIEAPPPVPIPPVSVPVPPSPETAPQPSVFISYSRFDDSWKERIITHLGILKHQGLLAPWSDQESLQVGENWYPAIERAINQAKIVILLVSPHFLDSGFILKEEIPRFLQRRESGELLLYPIICEPCAWQAVDWLSQMQIRPKRGKALSQFSKSAVESVLAEIAIEVSEQLKER